MSTWRKNVCMIQNVFNEENDGGVISNASGESLIELTWKTCVQFVEWYNKQNKES